MTLFVIVYIIIKVDLYSRLYLSSHVRFAESLETSIFSQVYDEIRKIENLNQVILYIKEFSDFYYFDIIYSYQ